MNKEVWIEELKAEIEFIDSEKKSRGYRVCVLINNIDSSFVSRKIVEGCLDFSLPIIMTSVIAPPQVYI